MGTNSGTAAGHTGKNASDAKCSIQEIAVIAVLTSCAIAAITVRKGALNAASQVVRIWSILTRTAVHTCQRTAGGRAGCEVVIGHTSRASGRTTGIIIITTCITAIIVAIVTIIHDILRLLIGT